MNIIVTLLLGALVGWIASGIMKSEGSLVVNILVGVAGSALGMWIAKLIGISAKSFSIGGILISIAGCCLLIYVVRKISVKK